jgi:WD40 repeat protein
MLPMLRSNLSMFVFLLVVSCGAGRPLCRAAEKLPYNLELLRTFVPPPGEFGLVQDVSRVGFTKNGRQVACLGGYQCGGEGGMYLWDTKTGGYAESAGPYPPSGAPSYHFDGNFATVPYARQALWLTTGLEVQDDLAVSKTAPIPLRLLQRGVVEMGMVKFPIKGEGSFQMGPVFFSADGEYLAALRFDGSIDVWKVRGGERVTRVVVPGRSMPYQITDAGSVAFDPTDRHLAAVVAGDAGTVAVVWDLKTGEKILHTHEKEFAPTVAVFAASGDLVCGEYENNGMDIKSGRVTVRKAGKFDTIRTINAPAEITSVAIAPGIGAVCGDWYGRVSVWDITTGKQLANAKEIGNGVDSVADIDSGKVVNCIYSVAVSPDGRLIVAGCNRVARLWKIVPATPAGGEQKTK